MPASANILKVISRNSTLALQQVSGLFGRYPGISYELKTVKSNGNLHEFRSHAGSPVQEFFAREPGIAQLKEKADLAIYAANELPYPLPHGLEVVALINTTDPSGHFEVFGLADFYSDFNPFELPDYLAIVSAENRGDLKTLFSKFDLKKRFGKVTLVGFGPGNPDLLTLGGDRALAKADIIFHDDLLDKEFLTKYTGEKVYVGKRKERHSFSQDQINRLLLEAAQAGKQVVRLKGGDPMVFAHGGEEVEYLQRNLVDVQVIPGVSAGIAASSYSKIPLTQRFISSSVAFISGHTDSAFLPNTDTLVIYMGGSTIKKIAARAIREGRDPYTPAILVHNVSLPDQREVFFTLKELSQNDTKFPTPIIIIIGEVVSLRHYAAAELPRSEPLADLNRGEKIGLMVNFSGN